MKKLIVFTQILFGLISMVSCTNETKESNLEQIRNYADVKTAYRDVDNNLAR